MKKFNGYGIAALAAIVAIAIAGILSDAGRQQYHANSVGAVAEL